MLVTAVVPPLTIACSGAASVHADDASQDRGRPGQQAGARAVPVTMARVVEKQMPVTVNAIGTVEAISTVQVRAQVTAQLSAISFNEGDDVAAGQLLFRLDPRPFEVALQQAEGVLARDRAQAANANAQFKRYDDLMTRGLLPRDQFEAQRATAAALEATVGADAAAVEAAKLNLQYTRVEAPVGGRTGALMVHQGDLVRANDTAPMVTINQVAPIYVTFAVPGQRLGDVRRYQAVAPLVARARVSGSESAADGRVTFIDNAVDTATDTIKLKATFANADRRLWPGSFVDVVLQLTTEPHAIVAPAAAVQAGQQGQFVYVVKSDRSVAVQPVTVARMESGEAVIAKGLKNGDTVVTDGQLRLTPGAHVADAAATNSGAPAP